jgi:hypothetical protein
MPQRGNDLHKMQEFWGQIISPWLGDIDDNPMPVNFIIHGPHSRASNLASVKLVKKQDFTSLSLYLCLFHASYSWTQGELSLSLKTAWIAVLYDAQFANGKKYEINMYYVKRLKNSAVYRFRFIDIFSYLLFLFS